MKNLTKKQYEVLEMIKKLKKEKGYSPTLKELAKELKKSVSCMQLHINTLYKKGYIDKDFKAWRSIKIKKEND